MSIKLKNLLIISTIIFLIIISNIFGSKNTYIGCSPNDGNHSGTGISFGYYILNHVKEAQKKNPMCRPGGYVFGDHGEVKQVKKMLPLELLILILVLTILLYRINKKR